MKVENGSPQLHHVKLRAAVARDEVLPAEASSKFFVPRGREAALRGYAQSRGAAMTTMHTLCDFAHSSVPVPQLNCLPLAFYNQKCSL